MMVYFCLNILDGLYSLCNVNVMLIMQSEALCLCQSAYKESQFVVVVVVVVMHCSPAIR